MYAGGLDCIFTLNVSVGCPCQSFGRSVLRNATVLASLAIDRYSGFTCALPREWAGVLRPTMGVLYQLSYLGLNQPLSLFISWPTWACSTTSEAEGYWHVFMSVSEASAGVRMYQPELSRHVLWENQEILAHLAKHFNPLA